MVRSYKFSLPSSSCVGWCGFVCVRIRPRETSARVASIVPRARFLFRFFRALEEKQPLLMFLGWNVCEEDLLNRGLERAVRKWNRSIEESFASFVRLFVVNCKRGVRCALGWSLTPGWFLSTFSFYARFRTKKHTRQGFRKTHVFILWRQR